MPKEVCLVTNMCQRAAMKQAYTAMKKAAIMESLHLRTQILREAAAKTPTHHT
jgi:hypothetical protein